MNEELKIKILDEIFGSLYAYAESEEWQEEIRKMNETWKVIEKLKEEGWIVG